MMLLPSTVGTDFGTCPLLGRRGETSSLTHDPFQVAQGTERAGGQQRKTESDGWGGEEERVSGDDFVPLGSLKLQWVIIIDNRHVNPQKRQKLSLAEKSLFVTLACRETLCISRAHRDTFCL